MITEYLYAFLMSQDGMRRVLEKRGWKIPLVMLIVALLAVCLPARQPFSFSDYAYNIMLLGWSSILINAVVAGLATVLFHAKFAGNFFGLLRITAAAFIINTLLLLLLYAIGIPFGASGTLLAAAATLISTYYFAVLLAIAAGCNINAESQNEKIKKYAVEITALLLWYAFTFYILALTI